MLVFDHEIASHASEVPHGGAAQVDEVVRDGLQVFVTDRLGLQHGREVSRGVGDGDGRPHLQGRLAHRLQLRHAADVDESGEV